MHKGQHLMMVGVMALASGSWGCSDASGEGSEEKLGSLEMRLASTAPSGLTYRLRNAILNEADGTLVSSLSSELNPDATLLTGDFMPGFYTVTLQDGWFLERSDIPGGLVDAQLVSGATQLANISTGITRTVSYKFRAADESIVFGGTLAIDIDVCGEDGFEPNDTPAQATNLPFNQLLSGGICGNNDVFSFTQNAFPGFTDFIELNLTQSVGDLDLEITFPDGTGQFAFTVNDQERIEFEPNQVGLHVVTVSGFQGATGNYTLRHGAFPNPPPAP